MSEFISKNLGIILVVPIYLYVYFRAKHIHKYQYHYEIGAFVIVNLIIIQGLLNLNYQIFNFITSGHLSLSLFLLVMFTGVLKKRTAYRKPLDLVRGEIAIIGFIFLLPHAFSRLSLALSGYNSTGLIASILFLPLVLTSFMFVRKQMKPKHWKLLHKLSYITYFMIYLHLGFIISINPNNPYILLARNSIIYHLLLLLYIALRFKNNILPKMKEKKIKPVT
jgi:methionine sulfoxide reductase heme-binding subunit